MQLLQNKIMFTAVTESIPAAVSPWKILQDIL